MFLVVEDSWVTGNMVVGGDCTSGASMQLGGTVKTDVMFIGLFKDPLDIVSMGREALVTIGMALVMITSGLLEGKD